MKRIIESRKPPQDSQGGLSKVSKIFFGVDIFQVVIVAVLQSAMIAIGNFNAYNNKENPGLGPGRRIYMSIFMGAVVYTCFICLFAVKKKNFMEILAFVLQNFGFVTYSCIQVYHVGFKKYDGRRISNDKYLPKIAVANTVIMLVLNGLFIVLSYKLYMEFGWKIYKRVRFNLRLRSLYHIYQLLSCLLKMEILYWGMYAICNSLVLLKNSDQTALFYVNLSFIPLSIFYAVFGYKATQWENRPMMVVYLFWTLGGIGYFVYKLYGYISHTCTGCPELFKTGDDIPAEAVLHFCYLGIINLVVLVMLLGVGTKAFLNFGRGLGAHFKNKAGKRDKTITDLNLRRFSQFLEESVISVASCDSVFDELNESMHSEKRETLFHGAVSAMAPLIAVQKTRSNYPVQKMKSKTGSLPNLGGAATRRNSYPGIKYQDVSNNCSSPTNLMPESSCDSKLAVISEDNEGEAPCLDTQLVCGSNENTEEEKKSTEPAKNVKITLTEGGACENGHPCDSAKEKNRSNGRLQNTNGTTVGLEGCSPETSIGSYLYARQKFSKGLRDWVPNITKNRNSRAVIGQVKDRILSFEQKKEPNKCDSLNPVRKGNGALIRSVTVEITSNSNSVTKVHSKLRTADKKSDI